MSKRVTVGFSAEPAFVERIDEARSSYAGRTGRVLSRAEWLRRAAERAVFKEERDSQRTRKDRAQVRRNASEASAWEIAYLTPDGPADADDYDW